MDGKIISFEFVAHLGDFIIILRDPDLHIVSQVNGGIAGMNHNFRFVFTG